MKEIWKPIKGYEGIYEVSTLGRVRSLDKYVKCCHNSTQLRKGKVINFIHKPNGYLVATLCDGGNRKNFYAHRLVAEAFIPRVKNKDYVNHIDRNRSNNRVDNLEWCNVSENIIHSVPFRKKRNDCRHGKYGYAIRMKNGVFEVGLDHKYLGRYKTLKEAEQARDNYLRAIGE